MRTLILAVALAATSIVAGAEVPIPDRADTPRKVTVMTRNVYHGVNAEFAALVAARGFPELLQSVAATYTGYFARNFPERAQALAAEIDELRPDLVGLQEAVMVRTQAPADGPASAATDVALDFVEILLDALRSRGLSYEVVVQSVGFDAELPSALGIDVRHTDREVILARADLGTAELRLSNAQAGHFAANCSIPSASLGPVVIRRGWAAVDARIRGSDFRLVTTHLDGDCLPFTAAIQHAQALEILGGPAATHLPVILIGDLNSPADGSGATYNEVIAAGFHDVAPLAGLAGAATCCQDAGLLNPASKLDKRIDLILLRGAFEMLSAATVGDDPSERTASGMWASDHAGVVALLRIPLPSRY